jgi:hypothetical protein
MTGSPFVYRCTVIRCSKVQTYSKRPSCSDFTVRLRTHCNRVAWRVVARQVYGENGILADNKTLFQAVALIPITLSYVGRVA